MLVVLLHVVTFTGVWAQVDVQRKLREAQQELQRYQADEKEYTERTQGHMDRAIRHVLENLSFGYLKERFGDEATTMAKDMYTVQRVVEAANRGDTYESYTPVLKNFIGKIAKKVGAGQVPAMVDTIFDLLYLYQDGKQLPGWQTARNP